MAVTSEWEWVGINRTQDITISGGILTKRNNWTATRKRISNDTFVSSLGTTATSLSAYNGGTIETVTAPNISVVLFNANTAWTLTSTLWIPTGYIRNGSMSYTQYQGTANIPDALKKNVAYLATYDNNGVFTYIWVVTEASPETVRDNSWDSVIQKWVGAVLTQPNGSDYVFASVWSSVGDSISGKAFPSSFGTFTGGATAYFSTSSVPSFYCSSDIQTYDQNGVDWFTQIQTWSNKDNWATI